MSTTIYTVEKEKDKYTHSNNIYVDVFSKDVSGIEKVSVHSEIKKYGFDQIAEDQAVYIVPIFTWE